MIKRKTAVIVGVVACMMFSVFAYAKVSSYSSSYDMTAGVLSRKMTAKKYIKTNISPEIGNPDVQMGVILAQKKLYGYDGPMKMVSSVRSSSVKFNCDGTYQIWLRNFANPQRWTGNVSFSWE